MAQIQWSDVQWYSRSRGTTAVAGPTVNIAKSGQVQISEAAMGLFKEPVEAFQVGLHQGRGSKYTLILQAAQPGDQGALKVSKPQTSRTYGLNTKKFLTENRLESVFGTKGIATEFDEEHGALLVSLS